MLKALLYILVPVVAYMGGYAAGSNDVLSQWKDNDFRWQQATVKSLNKIIELNQELEDQKNDAELELKTQQDQQKATVNQLNTMLVSMRNRLRNTDTEAGSSTVPDTTGAKSNNESESCHRWKATLDRCLAISGELATERDEIGLRLNALIDFYESTRSKVNEQPQRFDITRN